MKTAKEVYREITKCVMNHSDIEKAMIEFTKLHVTQALKEAYNKAELKEQEKGDEQICFMSNDMGDAFVLDKKSILNAYSLTNII